jgi:type IV secretory pathway VirB10-like protein
MSEMQQPISATEIQSPSGINLHPDPPSAVRISKKAGVAGLAVLTFVAALVLLGMYARQRRQVALSQRVVEEQRPNPATTAARDLVSKIAPAIPGDDLNGSTLTAPRGKDRSGSGQVDEVSVPALKPPLQYRATGNTSGFVGGQAELTPEEKLREQAYQREQEAILSPTLVRTPDFRAPTATASPPGNDVASQLGTLVRAAKDRGDYGIGELAKDLGIRSGTRPVDYEQQNNQEQKEQFLAKVRSREIDNYLRSTRTAPLSKYEIKAGWDIPAILEQAVNSDLPGDVKALVRSNVYDTATGKYLLIPQGSRLIGSYNSHVTYGQNGLQVIWTRIIFPDGSAVDLDGMVGTDAKGNSGFRFDVDNHYKRLIGFAVLTSLFSAGIGISQRHDNGTILATPTVGQTAGAAVGQQLGELGVEVTRRNLNVQPTIKIPIGYRFDVRVNRDMLFDSPYDPVQL